MSFNHAFDRKFIDIVSITEWKWTQFPSNCGQAFSSILTLCESRSQYAAQVSSNNASMSPLLEEKSKLTKSGNGIIKVDHIPLDSGFYTDSEYVIKMS